MIKVILWDFDGVIIDSMRVKGEAFVEIFRRRGYGLQYLQQIEQYHYDHGGVSRFEKIKHFYDCIVGEAVSDAQVIAHAAEFSEIATSRLSDSQHLIADTIRFIKNNHTRYRFHIVSGSEHGELNQLCTHFDLAQYFISIDGSPTVKDKLVSNVLKNYHYDRAEVALIGDAMTDYNAASRNDIAFYGYNNDKLADVASQYIHRLTDSSFD